MKRLLVPAILVLALAALVATSGCSALGSGGPVATNAVSIEASSFSPPEIIVKVGDTVTWTNKAARSHNVTRSDAAEDSFDSGTIAPNGTYSHTFDATGEVSYYDRYTPSLTGKITVK